MYPTHNDLSLAVRKKVITQLSPLLADGIDLKTQVKQAHWNVRGANFIALHELFDKIAAEVEDAVDTLAERIVQLGGIAEGTARVVAKRSRLKEYPLAAAEEQQHIAALASALGGFIGACRKAIDDAAGAGDAVTADICTGIARGLDKQLWFVEAHATEAGKKGSRVA